MSIFWEILTILLHGNIEKEKLRKSDSVSWSTVAWAAALAEGEKNRPSTWHFLLQKGIDIVRDVMASFPQGLDIKHCLFFMQYF